MSAKSTRVKIQGIEGVNLTNHLDVLGMIDEMRAVETSDGVSRASMVRILIKEGYEHRKKAKRV